MTERVQISVRIRPPEAEGDAMFKRAELDGAEAVVEEGSSAKALVVDHVFDPKSSNSDVFASIGSSIAETIVRDGYSAAVLAYGQTGSGKTHTIFGREGDPGLGPRIGTALFTLIAGAQELGREFLVRMQMVEVYNERVYDLGTEGRPQLKVRLNALGNFDTVGARAVTVTSSAELDTAIVTGLQFRSRGQSMLNDNSSRAHTIIRLIVESGAKGESQAGEASIASLSIVDLAGSESASSKATRTETASINKSLGALKDTMVALANNSKFVPFRNSELTKLLKGCLDGGARAHLITCLHPGADVARESRFSLAFAAIAQRLTLAPLRVQSTDDSAGLLSSYRKKISELKKKLERVDALDAERKALIAEIEQLRTAGVREDGGGIFTSSDAREAEARVKHLEEQLRLERGTRERAEEALGDVQQQRLLALDVAAARDSEVSKTLLQHEQEAASFKAVLQAEYERKEAELKASFEHASLELQAERDELRQQQQQQQFQGSLPLQQAEQQSSLVEQLQQRAEMAERRAEQAEAMLGESESQRLMLTMMISEHESRQDGKSMCNARLQAAVHGGQFE